MKTRLIAYGIKIVIESDDIRFINAAIGNMYFFKKEDNKNLSILFGQELHISYFKEASVICKEVLINGYKLGADAYLYDNKYIYQNAGLLVQIENKENLLTVRGQPIQGKGILAATKGAIRAIKKDYFIIVRKLLIFPLFYLMEKKCNIFLFHGSAMDYKGKGIAFIGLAGVGKSTAAISLTLRGEAKFVTDNFLLIDEAYMYPFPEYIRLHDDVSKVIGDVSQLGQAIIRRYKRNHYKLNDRFISGRIRPDIIFIPFLGNKTCIKEISTEVAIDRMLLANDHVKEFHTYDHSGLLSYLDYPEQSTYKTKMKVLESFLTNTIVYELGIKKGQNAYQIVEEVYQSVT